MNFVIITNINRSAGLAKHGIVLKRRIEELGHNVDLVDFRNRIDNHYDVAIHVELLCMKFSECADKNWWIPSLEWTFEREEFLNLKMIEKIDIILAVTNHGFNVLSNAYSCQNKVFKLGIESIDYGLSPNPKKIFFHASGGNHRKGQSVLSKINKQFTCIKSRIDESEYRKIQSSHLFHIYPSESESWCHAVHEAFGMGLLVSTFPEWDDFNGSAYHLTAPKRAEKRALINQYNTDNIQEDVEKSMILFENMSDYEITHARNKARNAFESESIDFKSNLKVLLS